MRFHSLQTNDRSWWNKTKNNLKNSIIQKIHKYVIRRCFRIIIKFLKCLKLLQQVSDHKGFVIRELFTAFG